MNGYPNQCVEKTIVCKLKDFISPISHTVKKCLVYLYLPCLGTSSVKYENTIKTSVKKCFFAE